MNSRIPPPGIPVGSIPAAPRNAPGPRPRIAQRLFLTAAGLAIWSALMVGRLVQVQVLHHEVMEARGRAQHQHDLPIPPLRGEVRDRHGRPLALTIARDSVYVVPPDYSAKILVDATRQLAGCLHAPESRVRAGLVRQSRFAWLKRRAEPEEVECARATGFPIGTIEEYGRYYPGASLAAQVVGFVGIDNEGLAGVEHTLDEVVRGEPGRRVVWTDGRRNRRGSRIVQESRAGAGVSLTLDAGAQAIAEEELARGIEKIGAHGGAVILVESGTGEIVALANAPTFDPNRVRDFPSSTYVNRTITDPYEPGSVFKMFTAAAALEEGVTHEEEVFDTSGGRFPIGRRIVRDWKPLGDLTFAGVIARSSNIGTLQVAERLGSATLRSYLDRFGFGQGSGLGLSGESRGISPPGTQWRRIRLATVSFGQGISVTPVQLVRAVNAIANGGVLVPLRLVREIGRKSVPFQPPRRVVSAGTASRVTRLLARAVAEGTGGAAGVDGFEVAGKTGTAQTVENGRYSETRYSASFAGFWPAEAPHFSGVVILDAEKPNHSGAHAARVFGRIAERMLRRYRRTAPGAEVLLVERPRLAPPRVGASPVPAAAPGVGLPERDLVARSLRVGGVTGTAGGAPLRFQRMFFRETNPPAPTTTVAVSRPSPVPSRETVAETAPASRVEQPER